MNQNFSQPFVSRALTSWISKSLTLLFHITPEEAVYLLELVAFFLVFEIFYKLGVCIRGKQFGIIASGLLMLTIPWFAFLPRYMPLYFLYDTYALLANVIFLYFLQKGKFTPFVLFFSFATFNRETSLIFAFIYFLVNFQSLGIYKLLRRIGLLLIIWVSIKLLLKYLFSMKGGEVYQDQYWSNIEFFLSIPYEIKNPIFFEPYYRFSFLIFPILLMFPLFRKQNVSILPLRIRKTLPIGLVILLIFLYTANIYEYRIFTEFLPIFILPITMIIVQFIQYGESLEST
ncbi:hypothetical protein [Leptospira paudalimensis]|uniref:Glycosyltransferase RgtA/B/C/D-like domain-containing protein n=1 Tax=Leptospira paudalimensis TaxID=2950024 RepID=A0ABT3M6W1_9LEPT|nr:hypothetical protein [Leptospira paudalimensis]MCW7503761.1 hypothetical protein [Leptospira paudalimensis]